MNPNDQHVIPTSGEHALSDACWCSPRVDDGVPHPSGARVWIHHEARTQAEEVALWSAFAARLELRFPFRVDVIIEPAQHHPERAQMRVRLHVLERETREAITVDSRGPCRRWSDDGAATDLLFDLLETALRHETYESVRLDGKLVNELHVRAS